MEFCCCLLEVNFLTIEHAVQDERGKLLGLLLFFQVEILAKLR